MPLESLATFITVSTLLSLAPGPDNIFVLVQSILHGGKSGVCVTLGLCTGLIVHTTAVALGIAMVVQTSILAFTVLKVLGVGYLMYLAWQAFRASPQELDSQDSSARSPAVLYRRGIIMNIANPKVTIFFLAFLPQFASPQYGSVTGQIFFLGAVFIVVALITFSAIAFTASAIGNWLRKSTQAQTYLSRTAGTVFVFLALRLATATRDF